MVFDANFSQDGAFLGTSHMDGTATVWDLDESLEAGFGKESAKFDLHKDFVTNIVFSPDGRHVLTSGFDGTARLFTLDIDELISLAKSRLTRQLTDKECRQYLHLESCPE